jgi:hypothetical protein
MAGVVLIAVPVLVDTLVDSRGTPRPLAVALVISGSAFIGVSLVVRHGRTRVALAKSSLVVLSLVFTFILAEIALRATGFNFEPPNPKIPIFNRYPTVHAGDGILRRAGPASWRGKPLSSYVQTMWGNNDAYPNEKSVEIRYDQLGFRNPSDLADWEIVVTGDSFVESGYLAYEEIFTSVAAHRLGVRIKNLGVSGTGTIFQTAYVRKYGKAPSTKHAVLSFFEGNDLTDIGRESQSTNYIRLTGHPLGGDARQSSLMVALQDRLRRLSQHPQPIHRQKLLPNAVVVTGNREYPITISSSRLPRWEELEKDRQELLAAALADWGKNVRALGMKPWVLYVPDCRRVFDGYLQRIDTNNPAAHWRLSPFAPHLGRICTNHNIGFIDTFPALRRDVETGGVAYNLFGDGHLSVHGSQVVGVALAEALIAEVQKRE